MERHFTNDLAVLKQKLLTMASHAEKAVRDSVNALVNRNLDLALQVKADDEVLDKFELEVDEMAINLSPKHRSPANFGS